MVNGQMAGATSSEMTKLTRASPKVTFAGQSVDIDNLLPYFLLPQTQHYVTYDGSLTYPGCHETVTWILLNKPVFITQAHVYIHVVYNA